MIAYHIAAIGAATDRRLKISKINHLKFTLNVFGGAKNCMEFP